MAILRPLVELAAMEARKALDLIVDGLVQTARDDMRDEYPWVAMPVEPTRFVPTREGRSLYAVLKRRSFRKQKRYPTWSDL